MTKEKILNKRKRSIQHLQLTSDIFFGVVLEDAEVCKEVIRIITGKNLEIIEVKNQYSVLQINTHSVRIDIVARDEDGNMISIEMHPQSNEDRVKRNRYNISSIDVYSFEKSNAYAKACDLYGIYITKSDFLNTNKGINQVMRTVRNTDVEIPNGVEEYYVCLACEGETREQTELINYLCNSDGVMDNSYFPNLVKRVRWIKEEQEGVEYMCEVMDEILKEGIEIGEQRGKILGRAEGELLGREEGKISGEKIMMTIVNKLIDEGRIDCIKRVASDYSYLKEMKEKYQL